MVAVYKSNFNGNEQSPLIRGQTNLEKYDSGVAFSQNMIGLREGPLTRRSGTRFMSEIKDQSKRTMLVPFEFSGDQAFDLEFGDQYLRFFKDRVQIESGGSPYEISTPYVQSALFDVNNVFRPQTLQSADVLYIFHAAYRPRALARMADDDWTMTPVDFEDGPYLVINTTSTTLTPSAVSGSITLTASSTTGINNDTGFQSTDVGRLVRFRDSGSKWTWLEITAVSSTTVVTATVRGPNLTSTTASSNWRLGTFSDTTGWPSRGMFHQGRIFLANSPTFPDRYEASKSLGYSPTSFIFDPSNADGEVADDNAFFGVLASNQVNEISWLLSTPKGLLIGTTAEEWIVDGGTTNAILSPSNYKETPLSRTGGYCMEAVRADVGSIFVQSRRRRLFDVIYSFEQDSQRPRDISVLSRHITLGKVIQLGYIQEPYNAILTLLNNGQLIVWTYDPDQKVFGPTRMLVGGVSDAQGSEAVIESFSVTAGPGAEFDELKLIVRRFINGGTKRYVEYMAPLFEDDKTDQEAYFVDCGITYSGVETETVSGLDHLEGETVKIHANGKRRPDQVVTSGSVSLSGVGATYVNVGLSNKWAVELLPPIPIPTRTGVTNALAVQRIAHVVLRLYRSLGLKYGQREGTVDEYDFNQGTEYDQATPLFTGVTPKLNLPNRGFDREAKVYFESDGPFPMTILAARMEGVANE